MTELIESIRTAYLDREFDVFLGDSATYRDHALMKAEVERGEAVPIVFHDLYPDKLVALGENERELAEASLRFNSGRLRLAAARLRQVRGLGVHEVQTTEEDYLALAGEIGCIVALEVSDILTEAKNRTTVPLLIGSQIVEEFYLSSEARSVFRQTGGRVNKKVLSELEQFARIRRGMIVE